MNKIIGSVPDTGIRVAMASVRKALRNVAIAARTDEVVSLDVERVCRFWTDIFTPELRLALIYGRDGVYRAGEYVVLDFAAELDAYEHDGFRIDLEPLVRDQVVLAFPVQPLCRENCAGLCQVCGGNRNEQPCACPVDAGDSRFAVLKRLRFPESS